MSKEWVDIVDAAQPGQLMMIFTNWTGVSDYSWWHPALHRHEFLVEFFKNQLKLLGNRHLKFAEYVNGQGIVDWEKAMVYHMTWTKEVGSVRPSVKTIAHHLTKQTPVEVHRISITEDMFVAEPYKDMRACFEGDPLLKHLLHNFFNNG